MFRFSLLLVVLASATMAQAPRKKLLAIGLSNGYQHDSVSHAMATLWKLGQESGLWDTFIRTDTQLITNKKLEGNAKNLSYFDAIFFYTTGDLKLDEEQKAAFVSFIHDQGKGFLGAHSATDTYSDWPEYGEIIGGYFDHHPWHQQVGIVVEGSDFPAMRHFPGRIEVTDEIYQFKNYSRDRVRVLMSLDASSVDLTKKYVNRTDKDFAVTWARQYGKGRVFYSSLGHREAVWDRPDIQRMWTEGVRWAMGLTEGDAKPRPKKTE